MRQRLLVFSLVVAMPLLAAMIPSAAEAAAGDFSQTLRLDQATLTATPNVTEVSYGNQAVTFSGQLTAVPSGGGSSYDVPNVIVYYTPAIGAPVQVGTTDSNGNYSGTVQNVLPGTFYLTTNATATVAAAMSPPVTITGIYIQLNFATLNVSPAKLMYNEIATLTGTVNLGPGSSTVVPGVVVRVSDGTVNLPKATTDSSGNFSVKFNTVNGENLQVTASDSNPLLTPDSVGLGIQVPFPVRSKSFRAKLEGNGSVRSSICLLTNPTNFVPPLQVNSVELQYAPTAHGRWRKLGMIPGEPFAAPTSCQSQWSYFSNIEAPFPGRLINAYYRVVIPASNVIEAFRSPVVHSFLFRSKVTKFNIRPRTVYRGGHITLTGRLKRQHGKSWRAYAHKRIVILARMKSRKVWSVVTSRRTNATGRFSLRLTAGSGRGKLVFAALFPGDSTYLWSLSRQITVGFNEPAAAALPASGGLRSLLVLPHRFAALRHQLYWSKGWSAPERSRMHVLLARRIGAGGMRVDPRALKSGTPYPATGALLAFSGLWHAAM
jgi:hypothetical protein